MSKRIKSLVEAVKYVENKNEKKPLNNLQMKFEEKLKAKLLECKAPIKEGEEEEIITSEIPTDVEEPTDVLPTEEIPTEEVPEELGHIDLTDNVEEVEDGVFTVPAEVHVELAPGAKVRFTHNDVEYIGTVGELVPEEEGIFQLEVEPATTDSLPGTEEFPNEEPGEGVETIIDKLPGEDLEEPTEEAYVPQIQDPGVNKETGIYEDETPLEEGLTMEDLEIMEAVELTEAPGDEIPEEAPKLQDINAPDAPEVTEVPGELPGAEVSTEELPSAEETGLEGAEDVNLEPGMETPGGGVSVGAGITPGGPSISTPDEPESIDTNINVTPIQEPEDVEQLVIELLQTEDVSKLDELAEIHSSNPEEMKEDDLMMEETNKLPGATTLKTEEPKIKVAQKKEVTTGEKFKNNPDLPKKIETELSKLKTTDIKGAAPKKTGDVHTKDELKKTGSGVPVGKAEKGKDFANTKFGKNPNLPAQQPVDYSKLKQESVNKVALNEIANKYVALEDENKKLRLENYKLLKVNGLLTLLPELKVETREQLVERFERCKDSKEVLNLYKKVVTLVKEERKPSLNKMILESKSEVKTIESATGKNNGLLKESTELTEDQKRKNSLMGIKGAEDYYYDFPIQTEE